MDRIVNAVFAKCHSNIIADLDKVGISRWFTIPAAANICAAIRTVGGGYCTTSNGDLAACAAVGTSPCTSATAANTSTAIFSAGGGHCSTVNRDHITTTILTAANTSTAIFSASGGYFAFGDCDFTTITFIAATDTSPLLRTNRCYIAAFNGDSCTVLCATTDSCTVISCTAIRHHCTTSNGDNATIATRATTDGCAIGCNISYTARISAFYSNMATIDGNLATTATFATGVIMSAATDTSAAALAPWDTPSGFYCAVVNGNTAAVPSSTPTNTSAVDATSGIYNCCVTINDDNTTIAIQATTDACTTDIVVSQGAGRCCGIPLRSHIAASNADVPAGPAVTAADTRSIFSAGGGHFAATDGDGAASFAATAADTRSVFPAGGGHSATSNGDAVTTDASEIFDAGGICVYRAAIDDDFARSSVNTIICCIHCATIDSDDATRAADVCGTHTICVDATAVNCNSTTITTDSWITHIRCFQCPHITPIRLGIDGQANTIVHSDTFGF